MKLDQRTIEILAQVVYKELSHINLEMRKLGGKTLETVEFWELHKSGTIELAKNIIRVYESLNPTSVKTSVQEDTETIPF